MSMIVKLTFLFGIASKPNKIRHLHQSRKIYQRFAQKIWNGMESSKPYSTRISTSTKLDKDERDKCVDSKLYISMISSLLYLITSRPDIMFNVC